METMYIVDRFEENFAVLEGEGGVMCNISQNRLPAGVKQGDVLFEKNGAFRVDTAATQKRREAIQKQLKQLFEESEDED